MSEERFTKVKCNHLVDKKQTSFNQNGVNGISTVREPCGYTLFFLDGEIKGTVSITCRRCRQIVKVEGT